MRNSLIGVGVALAIVVLLVVVSRLWPAPKIAQNPAAQTAAQIAQIIATQAAKVGPGFMGSADIGKWNLNCAQTGPKTVPAVDANGKPLPQTVKQIKFGRCRTALLVRNSKDPKSVALIAVFRLVDGSDKIAVILHTPPVTKPGAKVLIALAEKQVIGLPVASCEKGQCIALGLLNPAVYTQLAARPDLAVVIPVQASGQRMIVPLSTLGLSQSIQAIRRAA